MKFAYKKLDVWNRAVDFIYDQGTHQFHLKELNHVFDLPLSFELFIACYSLLLKQYTIQPKQRVYHGNGRGHTIQG
jgi:hypothetical protein